MDAKLVEVKHDFKSDEVNDDVQLNEANNDIKPCAHSVVIDVDARAQFTNKEVFIIREHML